MMITKQIVSPQANKPVLGIVQDSLLACKKMTKRHSFLDQSYVADVLMHLRGWDGQVPIPTILKPTPLWTGKQIFSLLIPEVCNFEKKNIEHNDKDEVDVAQGVMSPSDTKVIIRNGEVLAGCVDKNVVGAKAGGLIHIIWKELGPPAANDFISGIQVMVNFWLLHQGFTVGIGDTVADDRTKVDIERTISDTKDSVTQIVKSAQTNELAVLPGMTLMTTFEAKVNETLNNCITKTGKAAQASLDHLNNVKQMVIAGSKGSPLNISQMMACVGQQNVEGKRIKFAFRDRTLPHFKKFNVGPESKGFVGNSYLRGLTPQEF
eukprot:SAG31_NODE_9241_length_1309_cov_1.495041_1_plen_319_part_10